MSHPRADLTDPGFGEQLESAAAEIEQCSASVTETIGQPDVWTMAARFGDDGWNEQAEAADLFLDRGVGGGAVSPGEGTDPYDLPCYMTREGDTAETFTERIDAARTNGECQLFRFHAVSPTDQPWDAPVVVEAITDSLGHAKSLGTVWIDTVAAIGAYWPGQQILEEATVEESRGETVWTWSLPDSYPEGQHVRVTVDDGTLSQNGRSLEWNHHGYDEVSLDAASLTLAGRATPLRGAVRPHGGGRCGSGCRRRRGIRS